MSLRFKVQYLIEFSVKQNRKDTFRIAVRASSLLGSRARAAEPRKRAANRPLSRGFASHARGSKREPPRRLHLETLTSCVAFLTIVSYVTIAVMDSLLRSHEESRGTFNTGDLDCDGILGQGDAWNTSPSNTS